MDHNAIASLVRGFGVQETAARLLRAAGDGWSNGHEEFFREHWRGLVPTRLFQWLENAVPDGIEARAYEPIVPVLVAHLRTIASKDEPYAAECIINLIAPIADEFLRDDMVARSRAFLSSEHVEQLLPRVLSCPEFVSLADLSNRHVPGWIGHQPRLALELFEARREPKELMLGLRRYVENRVTRDYALWAATELGWLADVASAELVLADLPTLKEQPPAHDVEQHFTQHARRQFRHDMLKALVNTSTYGTTVTDRILSAASRGVPWGYLWWEIPEFLRDDIALKSIASARPAPWAQGAIDRHYEGADRWKQYLALWETSGRRWDESESFHRGFAEWKGKPRDSFLSNAFPKKPPPGWDEFWSPHTDEMLRTPPFDLDVGLEDRWIAVLRAQLPEGGERLIADLLAELPLTTRRARRIAELVPPGDDFYALTRCADIAAVLGRFEGSVPRPTNPAQEHTLHAYRALAGAHALVAWFDEIVREDECFWDALALTNADETLRRSGADRLRAVAPWGDFNKLLYLARECPWLITETDVGTALRSREYPDQQWQRIGTSPAFMRPFMEAKAATTKDADLARCLIERLVLEGLPRREGAKLAVDRVVSMGFEALPAYVVGPLLSTGKLWESPGRQVIRSATKRPSHAAAVWLCDVIERSVNARQQQRANDSVGEGVPTGDDPSASIVKVINGLVAEEVILACREAMQTHDTRRARALLRGLSYLSAPPRMFAKVKALRAIEGSDRVEALIDANLGLLSRSDDAPILVADIRAAIWNAIDPTAASDEEDEQ